MRDSIATPNAEVAGVATPKSRCKPEVAANRMLWALMVFTFVSPDGRVFDVSEDRDQLFDFAHEHGLISRRNNLSNVYKLVDASSGSKQLNY